MATWVSINAEGKIVEQIIVEEGEDPRWSTDSEGLEKVQLSELADLSEKVLDPETKSWKHNPEFPSQQADFNAGREHIKLVHAIKLVQAIEMLGLPTLVELEADELGIDPLELAQQIVDNSQDMLALELNRRQVKKGKKS